MVSTLDRKRRCTFFASLFAVPTPTTAQSDCVSVLSFSSGRWGSRWCGRRAFHPSLYSFPSLGCYPRVVLREQGLNVTIVLLDGAAGRRHMGGDSDVQNSFVLSFLTLHASPSRAYPLDRKPYREISVTKSTHATQRIPPSKIFSADFSYVTYFRHCSPALVFARFISFTPFVSPLHGPFAVLAVAQFVFRPFQVTNTSPLSSPPVPYKFTKYTHGFFFHA
jgi:hypothetical protein